MIICLCGSMKFKDVVLNEFKRLTLEGHTALTPSLCKREFSECELALLTMVHAQKILMSEVIYVVDIEGYIGEHTKAEIIFAENNGKQVYYHSDSYHDA